MVLATLSETKVAWLPSRNPAPWISKVQESQAKTGILLNGTTLPESHDNDELQIRSEPSIRCDPIYHQ